jgi:hypothetical protein
VLKYNQDRFGKDDVKTGRVLSEMGFIYNKLG